MVSLQAFGLLYFLVVPVSLRLVLLRVFVLVYFDVLDCPVFDLDTDLSAVPASSGSVRMPVSDSCDCYQQIPFRSVLYLQFLPDDFLPAYYALRSDERDSVLRDY
jgi:hypothetical protein